MFSQASRPSCDMWVALVWITLSSAFVTWRCRDFSTHSEPNGTTGICLFGLWAHDMIIALQHIGLLDEMGGKDVVLQWNMQQAKRWCATVRERCEQLAEQNMFSTLSNGKYSFLVYVIPTFRSPRPSTLSVGTLEGLSLYRFLLSAHLLEVEIGRYTRQQREHRYCQVCRRIAGRSVLGDEAHNLSDCIRSLADKRWVQERILDLFREAGMSHRLTGDTIYDMLPFLELLNRKQQQVGWKHVSHLTASIHNAIIHELQSQDFLPNKWKKMVQQKMVRVLVLAAERHFRKHMRRQIRSLPEMPLVVISDESENGDDESDVEFVLESFIPSLSRRAS